MGLVFYYLFHYLFSSLLLPLFLCGLKVNINQQQHLCCMLLFILQSYAAMAVLSQEVHLYILCRHMWSLHRGFSCSFVWNAGYALLQAYLWYNSIDFTLKCPAVRIIPGLVPERSCIFFYTSGCVAVVFTARGQTLFSMFTVTPASKCPQTTVSAALFKEFLLTCVNDDVAHINICTRE